MRQQIEQWWSARAKIVSAEDRNGVLIDQEEREWLRALGYVE